MLQTTLKKKKGEEGFRYKSYKWPYYVLMQAYEAYSDPKNNDIKSEMRTRDEFAKTFARSSMKARLSRRSFSSSS